MVYYQIRSHLEDYLLSDENIPGGMEGGLITVGLPICENFISWPSTILTDI